jgi:CRP/FNR family transcriptional regulator, cyclic AMP receptor protein
VLSERESWPSRNGWTRAGLARSGAIPQAIHFREGPVRCGVDHSRGSVKVITISAGGQERLPAVRGYDEIVGKVSAVWQVPRSATVQPIDPGGILSIPRSAFVQTLRQRPAAAVELIRVLGERRCQAGHERIEFGSIVPQRIATVLVEVAMHYPTTVGAIGLLLTQDELASLAATSRSALAALGDKRMVLTAPRQIILLDPDRPSPPCPLAETGVAAA